MHLNQFKNKNDMERDRTVHDEDKLYHKNPVQPSCGTAAR